MSASPSSTLESMVWRAVSPDLAPGAVIALAAYPNASPHWVAEQLIRAAPAQGRTAAHVALPPSESKRELEHWLLGRLSRLPRGDRLVVIAGWVQSEYGVELLRQVAESARASILLPVDIEPADEAQPLWSDLPGRIRNVADIAYALTNPIFPEEAGDDERVPEFFLTDLYRIAPHGRRVVLRLRNEIDPMTGAVQVHA